MSGRSTWRRPLFSRGHDEASSLAQGRLSGVVELSYRCHTPRLVEGPSRNVLLPTVLEAPPRTSSARNGGNREHELITTERESRLFDLREPDRYRGISQ